MDTIIPSTTPDVKTIMSALRQIRRDFDYTECYPSPGCYAQVRKQLDDLMNYIQPHAVIIHRHAEIVHAHS